MNVFIGKFKPLTYAHLHIIGQLVQNKHWRIYTTSKPDFLTAEERINYFRRIGLINVFPCKNPWEMADRLVAEQIYDVTLWCGEDRVKDYERLIKYFDSLGDWCTMRLHVFERPPIAISASDARAAIENKDIEKFKELSPWSWVYHNKLNQSSERTE